MTKIIENVCYINRTIDSTVLYCASNKTKYEVWRFNNETLAYTEELHVRQINGQ